MITATRGIASLPRLARIVPALTLQVRADSSLSGHEARGILVVHADDGRRKRSASRKAELVDVAAQIFMEKGYTEAGIEAILGQAGLTGPALYRHFSSKQDILDTVCLNGGRAMVDIAHSVLEEVDISPRGRMARLIDLRLDYLFGPGGRASFLTMSQRAHISEGALEQLILMQREFGRVFSDLLHDIRPDLTEEERHLLFHAVQSMVLYGIWRSRTRGLTSDEEYRGLLEQMIWDTLAA